jgi:hypothetical protein
VVSGNSGGRAVAKWSEDAADGYFADVGHYFGQ